MSPTPPTPPIPLAERIARRDDSIQKECAKYGLDFPQLFHEVEGQTMVMENALNLACQELLSRPTANVHKRGGNAKAIPSALVNVLAADWLARLMLAKKPAPPALVGLIVRQLGTVSYGLSRSRKPDARQLGERMRAENPDISNAKIAEAVGVQVSTVGRWFRRSAEAKSRLPSMS